MTNLNCSQCKSKCIYKPRPEKDEIFGANCDACKQIYCRYCSGINTTEAHAVALTTARVLLFFCPKCKNDLGGVMKEKKLLIDTLNAANEELKNKNLYIHTMEEDNLKNKEELEIELVALRKEIEGKDLHIKRLNRRTSDFEKAAIFAEQDFIG